MTVRWVLDRATGTLVAAHENSHGYTTWASLGEDECDNLQLSLLQSFKVLEAFDRLGIEAESAIPLWATSGTDEMRDQDRKLERIQF